MLPWKIERIAPEKYTSNFIFMSVCSRNQTKIRRKGKKGGTSKEGDVSMKERTFLTMSQQHWHRELSVKGAVITSMESTSNKREWQEGRWLCGLDRVEVRPEQAISGSK